MYIHENMDIDYLSVQSDVNKNRISNKIAEGTVDKGTSRPALMIIREFIRVVSSPRKVCYLCSEKVLVLCQKKQDFKLQVQH